MSSISLFGFLFIIYSEDLGRTFTFLTTYPSMQKKNSGDGSMDSPVLTPQVTDDYVNPNEEVLVQCRLRFLHL